MDEEVKLLTEPEELVHWLTENETSLEVSVDEAALLLQYMEGHDYALGYAGTSMIRKDLAEEQEEIQEYSICDAIDAVCEWNYELLCQTEKQMQELESQSKYLEIQSYYERLQAEEIKLDALFDRSPYGQEIEQLAVELAHSFLDKIAQGKDVSESVGELVGAVRQQNRTDNRGR